jgi:hypothetical protein
MEKLRRAATGQKISPFIMLLKEVSDEPTT